MNKFPLAATASVLLTWLSVGNLSGQEAASAATPPAVPLPTAPVTVQFFSPRTVLWLGRTSVIPFRVSQPLPGDLSLSASAADPGLVEIDRNPVALAGDTTGFLRVRALKPGHTRLLLHGDVPIELDIRPDPAAAANGEVNPESGQPRIISPDANAAVWGTFAVGVEVYDRFAVAASPDGAPAANGTRVQLRLPNGRLLDPVAQSGLDIGPERHCQFNVAASDLPPGPARLVAVAFPAAFSDVDLRAKRPGTILESDPLTVDVHPVQDGSFWSGECEDPAVMGNSKELMAPARTVASGIYSIRVPEVRPDPTASGGKMVAMPGGDDAWSLPFHVANPGMYQLFVTARGDFACGAYPSLGLFLASTETPAGTVRLSSAQWERVPVGAPVPLGEGPRMFTVAFRNDFSHGKEDRNLYLDRYEVARVGDLPPEPAKGAQPHPPLAAPAVPAQAANATPQPPTGLPAMTPLAPQPELLYPANGAEMFGLDTVVAKLTGDLSHAAWADVLVDGQPQGVRLQGAALAAGEPLLFPLPLRQFAPGTHRLAVRAADAAGQTADSPAREFNVLAQAPAAPGPYARAVFLLDRLAFGPEPKELTAVLTQTETKWLDNRLAGTFDAPSEQALLLAGCHEFPQIGADGQVINRALYQWLGSENPVRSRFTAWAENHFSTWINKTEGEPKWREHLAFCRLGIAPFADLLAASAHSPAMLKYLDQERSYAGKLNENYAREIMELHTLGVHGGYTQTDVTALAGVLNGWTTTREAVLAREDDALGLAQGGGNNGHLEDTFHFDPLMNDGKPREVFGVCFPATKDADARLDHIHFAMEMLASHPSTAEHVCRKMAEHYVGVPAPDALVHSMAGSFLASGGDMRAVLRAMAAHPDFWHAPPRLATPFDFGLRIARLCHDAAPPTDAAQDLSRRTGHLEGFLKKSGMGLFDRVTPDGYPENGANYADSNALLQRWRFMQSINEPLNRLVPGAWRTPPAPPAGMTAAANETVGSAPVVPDAGQRFIDLAAARLTGRLLDQGSNQAALEVLGQNSPEQMRETLIFIALLPETSLR